MPSERLSACFRDIVTAIDLIDRWVMEAGGVETAVHHNLLVRSAIERQLLTISEAATRLHKLDPTVASALAPEVDWAGIRGIGNFIRHKYDELDTRIIADVLQGKLAALRIAALAALQTLSTTEQ